MVEFIYTELDYHIESHENQFNINPALSHPQNITDTENDFTSNYLLPILASIGATSLLLGCYCGIAYYWHINDIDTTILPLPYNYFAHGGLNYPELP